MQDVQFSTHTRPDGTLIGVCTLSRERALHALTLEMCDAMLTQLTAWKNDAAIVAIVLRAQGEKAFCAGGDVAEVVRQVKAGGDARFDYGDNFFTTEYALNALIHTFPKPVIALAQGITMGGGMGLMVGASHRIVSTGARLAMPEIHIGLFPDVGGGFFLNRVPCRAGWLMALTGVIVNEHDAVLCGLADAIVPTAHFEAIFQILKNDAQPLTHDRCTQLLMQSSERITPDVANAPLWQRLPTVHELMHVPNVTAVRDGLNTLAQTDAWFATPAKSLSLGSPTTAHVAWAYLQRCATLGIADVLKIDVTLAKQFPRHHDFLEGVRAVLIDKDKNPRWSPTRFEDVAPQLIEAHFAPLR